MCIRDRVVQPQAELPCPDISTLVTAADLPVPSNNLGSPFCNLVVATNDEDLENINLTVFPNPSSDQINFQLSGEDHFLSIHLYRMDGKLVKKIENFPSSNGISWLEKFASGAYVYQVRTSSGNSISGKVIFE